MTWRLPFTRKPATHLYRAPISTTPKKTSRSLPDGTRGRLKRLPGLLQARRPACLRPRDVRHQGRRQRLAGQHRDRPRTWHLGRPSPGPGALQAVRRHLDEAHRPGRQHPWQVRGPPSVAHPAYVRSVSAKTGPGRAGSPRAAATSAERTNRLRYHSARPSRSRRVDHAGPAEPVVGRRARRRDRVRSVAQVAAAQCIGQSPGHRELPGGALLGDRRVVAFQVGFR